MIDIVQSGADKDNSKFRESPRKGEEDNITWLQRQNTATDDTVLVLFGGVDAVSFRIRTAQSYARQSLTPSHWSDVVFLKNPRTITERSQTYEASLQPRGGFGFPPVTNGIQTGTLVAYRDRASFPNVALLTVPVPAEDVKAAIDRFQTMRHIVNGVEILTAWLAFVWGVKPDGNPLLQQIGVPSAVLMHYAVGTANFDLTPGLASRASCPEAIWQAAKWWHRYYATRGEEGTRSVAVADTDASSKGAAISGAWVVGHRLCEDE